MRSSRAVVLGVLGVSCALGGVTSARTAQALPLASVTGTLYGLYGSGMGEGTVDAFGPGVGLQAGVALASFYIGASYQHFFGLKVEETLLSDPSVGIERTASLNMLLGHVGYQAGLGPLVLRPSLGLGYASTDIEVLTNTVAQETRVSSDERDLAVSAGAEARFGLGLLSACGELRYDTILREGANRSALIVGIGLGIDL